MIRIDAIWLALGASDLRAGMDTLLSRVVREHNGGARIHCADRRCHHSREVASMRV